MNAIHRFYSDSDEFQWTPVTRSVSYRSSWRLDSTLVGSWLGLGARGEPEEEQEVEEADPAETEPQQPFGSPTAESAKLIDRREPQSPAGSRLWSLTLGHDYGWTRGILGGEDQIRHSLDGSLNFTLPKWTFTISARYDFARKEMVRQSLNIYRDLHCFEARLQIVPTGPGRGYWFVIGIKEIPEIKYERRQTFFGR
jgi:hypothetical protein